MNNFKHLEKEILCPKLNIGYNSGVKQVAVWQRMLYKLV